MSDLYEDDIVLWSERQGALLRRRAEGQLVNGRDLDWPNIAEEVESVGRSELRSVESLLVQALAHRLKADAWPTSREVPGWRAEARRFRDDAMSQFVPSMRQRLDTATLYCRALRAIPDTIDDMQPVPQHCPMTLDELLSDAP